MCIRDRCVQSRHVEQNARFLERYRTLATRHSCQGVVPAAETVSGREQCQHKECFCSSYLTVTTVFIYRDRMRERTRSYLITVVVGMQSALWAWVRILLLTLHLHKVCM